MWTLAIDAMGGDNAPKDIIGGALKALETHKDINVQLYGIESEIRKHLDTVPDRVTIIDTPEVIETCEPPLIAIRKKKNSSLIKGLAAVKEKKADAFISAGSTGAVLAGALFGIGRIKGIDRPALAPILPANGGKTLLIDCGANADCEEKFLLQFAKMGSAYMELVEGVESPRVGLVNNGTEEGKGNKLYKSTHQSLKAMDDINFIGNVEARDAIQGLCDVLVCDGFTGNVLLKSTEGTALYIFDLLKKEITRNFITKMGYLLLKKGFKNLKGALDYKEYGGSPLLGIEGCVIKAHGSSDVLSFSSAINQAVTYLEKDVTNKISEKISAE